MKLLVLEHHYNKCYTIYHQIINYQFKIDGKLSFQNYFFKSESDN